MFTKSKYFLLFGLFYLAISSCNIAPDTWEKIKEKTWFVDNGFAGEQLVFYQQNDGTKKAIYQYRGSGVYSTGSALYDLSITGDSISLKLINPSVRPGTDKKEIKLVYSHKDSILRSFDLSLMFKIDSDEPQIFGNNQSKIDINKLKEGTVLWKELE